MEMTLVSLSKLVPSPLNVRKTVEGIDDLAASIKDHGLQQNLVVIDRGDTCEVVAGGLRLRALQQLRDEGKISADYEVPCNFVDEARAHEISMTENITRHAMHPADEFDAFRKLADSGHTAAEIAARFGKTELYVLQRMKLALVAPDILQEYRDGKASLEQMMALTLSNDQARQQRVWAAARGSYQREPRQLREKLSEGAIALTSRLGKFVGLKAYVAAGGKVRRDLFGNEEDVYFDDRECVDRLAEEKLQLTAERVRKEGWAWVEVSESFEWAEKQKFGSAPFTWKGTKQVYSEAAKKHAGAVVHISYNGQAEVERGLVKPKDRKALEKNAKGKVVGGKKTVAARVPGELSFSAVQRLQADGGAIVAQAISKSPALALKLLVCELADDAFYSGYEGPRTWVHIGREHTRRMPGMIAGAIEEESPAAQNMKTLEKAWRQTLPKKRAEARAWIFEQEGGRVLELLAFLVAREIDVVDNAKGGKQGIVSLAEATDVNLADAWKPSVAWLATLPKAAILAMAKDAGVDRLALATLAKLPKAKLPKAAAEALPAGWLPKPLRGAAPKKPRAAKKAAKTAPKKVAAKKAKPAAKPAAAADFPWGSSSDE